MINPTRVLFKYYPPQRIDVLDTLKVVFSFPEAFNDPFEFSPSLATVVDRRVVPVRSVGAALPHVMTFCLSEEPDNLVMWAMYADSHRGFVVGFDSADRSLTHRADGKPRRIDRVNYTSRRPGGRSLLEVSEEDILSRKSLHWAHEKEVRVFDHAFHHDDRDADSPGPLLRGFRLEPTAFVRVITGCRMSTEDKAKIRSALAAPQFAHVEFCAAALDDTDFGLHFDCVV